MRYPLLLLLLCLCANCFAQPGTPSLSISFRVFDTDGREVTPADKRFKISYAFDPGNQKYPIYLNYFPYGPGFRDTTRPCYFKGYWLSIEAYRLPTNFRLLIIRGRDTMQVYPPEVSEQSSVAGLPPVHFRSGRYRLPPDYMYALVFFQHDQLDLPDWSAFEIGHEERFPYYFFERVRDATFDELFFGEDPRLAQSRAAFTERPDSVCPNFKAFYWKFGSGLALVTPWHAHLITGVLFEDRELLLQEYYHRELIFHSDSTADHWKTYWPAGPGSGKEEDERYYFSIKQFGWNITGRFYEALGTIKIKGVELSAEQQLKLTGWYHIYLDVHKGSEEYKALQKKVEDLIAETIRSKK